MISTNNARTSPHAHFHCRFIPACCISSVESFNLTWTALELVFASSPKMQPVYSPWQSANAGTRSALPRRSLSSVQIQSPAVPLAIEILPAVEVLFLGPNL